jgi:hypothetical protein
MVFTVMAALAQMEFEIKRERITDTVSKRRAARKGLGGRRHAFTDRAFGMSSATLYRRLQAMQRAEAKVVNTS